MVRKSVMGSNPLLVMNKVKESDIELYNKLLVKVLDSRNPEINLVEELAKAKDRFVILNTYLISRKLARPKWEVLISVNKFIKSLDGLDFDRLNRDACEMAGRNIRQGEDSQKHEKFMGCILNMLRERHETLAYIYKFIQDGLGFERFKFVINVTIEHFFYRAYVTPKTDNNDKVLLNNLPIYINLATGGNAIKIKRDYKLSMHMKPLFHSVLLGTVIEFVDSNKTKEEINERLKFLSMVFKCSGTWTMMKQDNNYIVVLAL